MKILQVSHGLPPRENAGVELFTFFLSKALAQLNHRIHIFCREEDASKEEFSVSEEEIDGLKVTRVVNNFTWRSVSDPRAYYDNPLFDKAFLDTLKKERPNLVHFQHIIGHSANLVKIAKREGYPVVMTLHDFFILCHRIHLLQGNGGLCQGPLYGLECLSCLRDIFDIPLPKDWRTKFFLKARHELPFPILKWTKRFFIPPKYLNDRGYEVFHRYRHMYEMFKACDLLLTPSQYLRDFFLKYYPVLGPKIRALPLGIPAMRPPSRPKSTGKRIRFCYFGNILSHKGLHIMIDAFKSLPQEKATLTIYGSRNSWTEKYYDRLREQASGFSVHFEGGYQREDLPDLLSDQDVVVLPSIWPETFSIVIREAHMAGVPVIASRIGAIPEAIQDGVSGLLFKPGISEELKRCMLRFIESPRLVQEMASGIPRIKSMEDHAVEVAELYEETIRKNDKILELSPSPPGGRGRGRGGNTPCVPPPRSSPFKEEDNTW